MSIYLHYETATGKLTGLCNYNLVGLGESYVELFPGEMDGDKIYLSTYILNGVPTTKPTVAFPTTGNAPYSWDVSTFPEGTVIVLENESGQQMELVKPDSPITLTDAGIYRITIRPPFPYAWIEGRELEVTDA